MLFFNKWNKELGSRWFTWKFWSSFFSKRRWLAVSSHQTLQALEWVYSKVSATTISVVITTLLQSWSCVKVQAEACPCHHAFRLPPCLLSALRWLRVQVMLNSKMLNSKLDNQNKTCHALSTGEKLPWSVITIWAYNDSQWLRSQVMFCTKIDFDWTGLLCASVAHYTFVCSAHNTEFNGHLYEVQFEAEDRIISLVQPSLPLCEDRNFCRQHRVLVFPQIR